MPSPPFPDSMCLLRGPPLSRRRNLRQTSVRALPGPLLGAREPSVFDRLTSLVGLLSACLKHT